VPVETLTPTDRDERNRPPPRDPVPHGQVASGACEFRPNTEPRTAAGPSPVVLVPHLSTQPVACDARKIKPNAAGHRADGAEPPPARRSSAQSSTTPSGCTPGALLSGRPLTDSGAPHLGEAR
jgi:hypothetical protein